MERDQELPTTSSPRRCRSPRSPPPTARTPRASVVAGDAGPVAVFSVHPKCCGFIGSSEDARGIEQKGLLLGVVGALRDGSVPGAEAFSDAPALIAGDWNLVGSRTPLSMLESSPFPGMTSPNARNLIGGSVATWRGRFTGPGAFTPGASTSSPSRRRSRTLKSFVLDSRALDAGELAGLGLQQGDSDASDHLLLVVDIGLAEAAPARACREDLNLDGFVGLADIAIVARAFGSTASALSPEPLLGDLDDDGLVGMKDVGAVIAAIGDTCEG